MDIRILEQFIMSDQAIELLLTDEMIWVAFTFTWTWRTSRDRGNKVKIHALLLEHADNSIFSSAGRCRKHEKEALSVSWLPGLSGHIGLHLKLHAMFPDIIDSRNLTTLATLITFCYTAKYLPCNYCTTCLGDLLFYSQRCPGKADWNTS